MATYKELHGSNIEVVASDPSNPVVGQVWYNTTTNVMKGFTSNPAGSWATAAAANTARGNLAGSPAGTTTAALATGGVNPGNSNGVGVVESYNGSAWTEIADLNTARKDLGAGGTSTSNIAFGGETGGSTRQSIAESWNGTSWTEVTDMNGAKQQPGSTCLLYTSDAADE